MSYETVECPDCYGSGYDSEDSAICCMRCQGNGVILAEQAGFDTYREADEDEYRREWR